MAWLIFYAGVAQVHLHASPVCAVCPSAGAGGASTCGSFARSEAGRKSAPPRCARRPSAGLCEQVLDGDGAARRDLFGLRRGASGVLRGPLFQRDQASAIRALSKLPAFYQAFTRAPRCAAGRGPVGERAGQSVHGLLARMAGGCRLRGRRARTSTSYLQGELRCSRSVMAAATPPRRFQLTSGATGGSRPLAKRRLFCRGPIERHAESEPRGV